jgi:formylglycine-generating enzyme required for sulfatase activity
MLDTCRSGALEDITSSVDRAWNELGQKSNLAILMAAAGNQYAIESDEDRQGVLTWTVLRGLEGRAQPRDGRYMGANEILEYVRRGAPLKAEDVVARAMQKKLQGGEDGPVAEPLGEVAVKGLFDTASLTQEPVVKAPGRDFDLFDLKWRPAEVRLISRSAGVVTIKGAGPERKVNLEAGKVKTEHLRDGRYEFTINYRARIAPETLSRDIVNETPAAVEFTGVPETKPAAFVPPVPVPPAGFVYVKPGTFLMGSPAGEEGRTANETRHEVTLNGFFIAKHEVTQKDYAALMRNNPSRFKGDSNPVEQVSWFDAVRYCNEKSRREGLVPAYAINGANVTWNRAANGYRLPTEAEWEYACRAGNSGPFSVDQANFNRNLRKSGSATNPVGSIAPNKWGLHDMQGNVWEWCWDWLGNYPTGKQTDPTGPASGTLRSVRGGGYYTSNEQLRSAYRGSDPPDYKDDSLGFRIARNTR